MACNAFQVSLSMHRCYWLANMCHGESTCHAIQAAANTVIMKFRLHVSSGFKTTDKHKTPSIETNSQTSQPQIKQERKGDNFSTTFQSHDATISFSLSRPWSQPDLQSASLWDGERQRRHLWIRLTLPRHSPTWWHVGTASTT